MVMAEADSEGGQAHGTPSMRMGQVVDHDGQDELLAQKAIGAIQTAVSRGSRSRRSRPQFS